MIVAVKRNKKQKFIKILAFSLVALMFVAYYFHMSSEFQERQRVELATKKAAKIKEEKEKANKIRLEKAILSEIEKAIDLIGQEYVRHVQILQDKLIIICEPETNLDALMVRYGAMALTKKTLNEVIIAVDIKHIVESRLNEK